MTVVKTIKEKTTRNGNIYLQENKDKYSEKPYYTVITDEYGYCKEVKRGTKTTCINEYNNRY